MPVRNTSLYICYGIPWPRDHSHVRLFNSPVEQSSYIQSKAKFPVQGNLAYIRDNTGTGIRINIAADELKDCNYVAFQNLGYDGTWHYAFIDSVSYVNDGLSIIYFTLDWFQTFLFHMEIQPGLVLREHVNDDTIGANTLQEPVMHGPTISDFDQVHTLEYEWYVYATEKVIVLTWDDVTWYEPGEINHTGYYTAKVGSISRVNELVQRYTILGKLEALVAVFARPDITWSDPTRPVVEAPPRGTLDGYQPRNNKLFTYPYQYLNCVGAGAERSYIYEYFKNDGTPEFTITMVRDANTDIVVTPNNYMVDEELEPAMSPDYSVAISGCPTEGIMANAFLNKMISKPLDSLLAIGTAAAFMGAGTTTSAAGSALVAAGQAGGAYQQFSHETMSGIGGLIGTNAMSDLWADSLTPNSVVGSGSAASVFNYDKLYIKFKHMTVKNEYAKVIDQFFDMFGYRVCQVKAPNLTGRTSWNYVQMQNCVITGNAPVDAIQAYTARVNAGITYWHTDDVGNYSLSNTIIEGD